MKEFTIEDFKRACKGLELYEDGIILINTSPEAIEAWEKAVNDYVEEYLEQNK